MNEVIRPLIDDQMIRLNRMPESSLLSKQAVFALRRFLEQSVYPVLYSTWNHMKALEMKEENPFAVYLPELLTREQSETARRILLEKMKQGTARFPEPVQSLAEQRLKQEMDAVSEMLRTLHIHQAEISQSLLDGELFTRIEDIHFGAGDSHRQGKTVCIVTTDAGIFVYKPRNLRADELFYQIAAEYFGDLFQTPKALALEEHAGVCEFIKKQHAQGEAEARSFYHNLGALAAFFKGIGSTDMHVENISCNGVRPVVLDLETMISPMLKGSEEEILWPQLNEAREASLYFTTILPKQGADNYELSALSNTTEDGCAPFVDGRFRDADAYMPYFLQGYQVGYRRCSQYREKILGLLEEAAPDLEVRVLLTSSQYYANILKKLFQASALETWEAEKKSREQLLCGLNSQSGSSLYTAVNESTVSQLYRGDVPFFYLMGNSCDLMADGHVIYEGYFHVSPVGHAAQRLKKMSPQDEAFDLALLQRAMRQYPLKRHEDEQLPIPPVVLTQEELSPSEALKEAETLFQRVLKMAVRSPGGKLFWGERSQEGGCFQFCGPYFSEGLSGIGVFAAAVLNVSEKPEICREADLVLTSILEDLAALLEVMQEKDLQFMEDDLGGEYSGVGGILTALALIRRYAPEKTDAVQMQERILKSLCKESFEKCQKADRITGISALISVLCRFPEYQGETGTIQRAAQQLLRMQTLPWKKTGTSSGETLWQTLPDIRRPISGAGHGMAGIAQALIAAWRVTGDAGCLSSAKTALDFEASVWSEELGTWPDFREYPSDKAMHGYCSGAPGIGIMIQKIKSDIQVGAVDSDAKCIAEDPTRNWIYGILDQLELLAETSVRKLPLRKRDHLCCGNSSIAEYYICRGDRKSAGRVLSAMKKRRENIGKYCYLDLPYKNTEFPSMMFGTCGIGYEMLRYACPEKMESLFI